VRGVDAFPADAPMDPTLRNRGYMRTKINCVRIRILIVGVFIQYPDRYGQLFIALGMGFDFDL
jgi:hypothetical protein